MSAPTTGETQLGKAKDQPGQVKETLISLIIAFVMAFVFRAFVAEAFIIPTGSMAPTLLGAHSRHQAAATGSNWPVNPPMQATGSTYPAEVRDPMSGQDLREAARRRAGDRILVFKYLYSVYDPKRWDVVVFKAPHEPQTNYIKRLVALPGEEPALIDGDVFTRPADASHQPSRSENTWSLGGWEIQRKPERVQRTVWQDVYWSQYEPILPVTDGQTRMPFRSPWRGGGSGWRIDGRQSYEYSGAGSTTLTWDNAVRPIEDYYSYNRLWPVVQLFPVSDVNMSLGLEPRGPLGAVSAVVRTRGHEFRADVDGGTVTLRMAPIVGNAPGAYRTLASATMPQPAVGAVMNLEFWHVDQSLQLWADGRLVAMGTYDWSPDERLRHTFGATAGEVFSEWLSSARNPLVISERYPSPQIRWEFGGGEFVLHRVGLQRDIHYQPANFQTGPMNATPARASHPASAMFLGRDHFFVLGDNSPLSADARLWGGPDPWVAELVDPADGVVPRDLLIGRAFFVYFPALSRGGLGLPVPDFGRMRWIW
jgi:signal peptidase I